MGYSEHGHSRSSAVDGEGGEGGKVQRISSINGR